MDIKITNQKHCLLTKTNTRRADEWNGSDSAAVFYYCFFSQKRNGFDKVSSAVTNMSWYSLHSVFSKRKSLSTAAVNLFDNFSFFFHLIVNDTLRQQTTALEGLPPYFVWCKPDTQVKRWGFFFHQRKKWLHQNVLRWRKYELISVALYILQMTIRERSYR